MRTLIVDDEPLAVERLRILCARIAGLDLVGAASDGTHALRLIESLRPDLILLDIQMPGLDGMGVARALANGTSRPAVIFVTAFDQFAVAAFDVAAMDYLLKPVEAERLERAIARVRDMSKKAQDNGSQAGAAASPWIQEFWVPDRAEIIRIAARDIDLIEAERDYMRLHVGARSFLLHKTITELERRLDPAEFLRIHRSTLVRRDRIARFRHKGSGAWEAQLQDGRWLRVGRSYLANARALTAAFPGASPDALPGAPDRQAREEG